MQITAVEQHARHRSRVIVYVDGIAALEIARSAARARDLRPGRALDSREVTMIAAAEERREALAGALALLARRPRSEREVRRRLAKRGSSPAVVEETVAKLHGLRLLDDAAFAQTWAESRDRTSPRGRRLIASELRAQGVATDIAAAAADEAVSDEEAAYRLASRRAASMRGVAHEAFRARLGGLLRRRGFGWPVTRATVERCWRESAATEPPGVDA